MATHGLKTIAAGATPTLISATGEDITSITIANISGSILRIYPTAAETPPALTDFYVPLLPNGVIDNRTMADLAPGITAIRVYAWAADNISADVMVSHA